MIVTLMVAHSRRLGIALTVPSSQPLRRFSCLYVQTPCPYAHINVYRDDVRLTRVFHAENARSTAMRGAVPACLIDGHI
jgi:hypothetical protein